MCSKLFYKLCSQSKRLSKAKQNSHDLINKGKDNIEFLASFFDEYLVMLRNVFGRDVKQHIVLSVKCLISDLMFEMTHFRVFCHVFHCKRGFNIVDRCQCCTCFFVDSSFIRK